MKRTGGYRGVLTNTHGWQARQPGRRWRLLGELRIVYYTIWDGWWWWWRPYHGTATAPVRRLRAREWARLSHSCIIALHLPRTPLTTTSPLGYVAHLVSLLHTGFCLPPLIYLRLLHRSSSPIWIWTNQLVCIHLNIYIYKYILILILYLSICLLPAALPASAHTLPLLLKLILFSGHYISLSRPLPAPRDKRNQNQGCGCWETRPGDLLQEVCLKTE